MSIESIISIFSTLIAPKLHREILAALVTEDRGQSKLDLLTVFFRSSVFGLLSAAKRPPNQLVWRLDCHLLLVILLDK